jgi:hypothetical protein
MHSTQTNTLNELVSRVQQYNDIESLIAGGDLAALTDIINIIKKTQHRFTEILISCSEDALFSIEESLARGYSHG